MASTKSNLCDLSMTAGAVVYKYVFLLLLQETQILGHTCVEHNKYRQKRNQVVHGLELWMETKANCCM